jgi:hypothetical protein
MFISTCSLKTTTFVRNLRTVRFARQFDLVPASHFEPILPHACGARAKHAAKRKSSWINRFRRILSTRVGVARRSF